MAPLPLTGSNARSIAMQRTQVAYGGCWKCLHTWQRCSASTPRLADSQKGFVHSFGTGIGRVTLFQSLVVIGLAARAFSTCRSLPETVADYTRNVRSRPAGRRPGRPHPRRGGAPAIPIFTVVPTAEM